MNLPTINLASVKGILIDLDNTIYAYEPCHKAAIKKCHSLFSDISLTEFETIYRTHRNDVTEKLKPQGACRSRLFAFQAMFEQLNIKNAYSKALKFTDIYWETFINEIKIDIFIEKFFEKVKAANIPVCIITDMLASTQIKKINKLQITNTIDFLVTSEEAGTEKPDPKIFKLALAKLKLAATEVIMIGDSKTKDIEVAEALGIKSYLYQAK